MKGSRRIAMAGMLSALTVVILLSGSLFQVLDLSAAAAAALVIVVILIEMDTRTAVLAYAVSAVISILLPYKLPGLIFALFTGYYPIIKRYIQRVKLKAAAWGLKLIVFNVMLTAIALVAQHLLGMPVLEEFFGLVWLLYLMGNIVFILYDIAIDRLIVLYMRRIRPRFAKLFSRDV